MQRLHNRKLVADESVDFSIVSGLRNSGFTVISIFESHSGLKDKDVLQLAFANKQLLITEDKDFGELSYRLKMKHAGILLIRMNDIPREERIPKVVNLIIVHFEMMQNKFCVLTPRGLRVKIA